MKFIALALVIILFIIGEYFQKHGGRPLWFWIVMVIVVGYGIAILGTSFILRKKQLKNKDDENNEK